MDALIIESVVISVLLIGAVICAGRWYDRREIRFAESNLQKWAEANHYFLLAFERGSLWDGGPKGAAFRVKIRDNSGHELSGWIVGPLLQSELRLDLVHWRQDTR